MKIKKQIFTLLLILAALLIALAFLASASRTEILSLKQNQETNHSPEHQQMNQGQGLIGRYFNTPDFTGKSFTRMDKQIDFDWEESSPDPKITSSAFSVIWLGLVIPSNSEDYTFYIKTNYGVRLSVNNEVLIDQLGNTNRTEFSAKMTLEADKGYPLVVEYTGAKGSVELSWSSPSTPKQIIPQKNLFEGSDDRILSPE